MDGIPRPDLRAFYGRPIDGDLLDNKPVFLGKKQDLDVERPTSLLELRENALRRGAPEEFEAALSILDARHGEQICDAIERRTDEFAQERPLPAHRVRRDFP